MTKLIEKKGSEVMATMLAARLDTPGKRMDLKTIPVPEPAAGQVRVKVMAAGVCLSDVHLIDGSVVGPYQLPEVTLGHEIAGTIDKLGDGVTSRQVGTRVLVNPIEFHGPELHTIGVDYDGGWAEYVVVREESVVDIGPDLPFEQAAIIPDAVSTPWGSISEAAKVRPGESVGVWGVGGLGYHGVKLLRMIGAAPIIAIDPLESARERALKAGADAQVDPNDPAFEQKVKDANGGRGLDAAFDFAGYTPVRQQAFNVLDRLGRLVLVGITGDPLTIASSAELSVFQKSIIGHYGSEPRQLHEIVKLTRLGRRDFSASISKTYPLSEPAAAVKQLQNKIGNPTRFVLKP